MTESWKVSEFCELNEGTYPTRRRILRVQLWVGKFLEECLQAARSSDSSGATRGVHHSPQRRLNASSLCCRQARRLQHARATRWVESRQSALFPLTRPSI